MIWRAMSGVDTIETLPFAFNGMCYIHSFRVRLG